MVTTALIGLYAGDLPGDALVSAYTATEGLSRPYRVMVDFSTADRDFDVDVLLRARSCLSVSHAANGSQRFFDGLVSEAGFERLLGERHHFRLVLRPGLWLLSLREDARIFQNCSTPDIVKLLLDEAGLATNTEWKLGGKLVHEPFEFKVLYRESPLNFIQRLCEDAGIFYYFTHTQDGHTLHFSDDLAALDDLGEAVPFSLARAELATQPLLRFCRSMRLRTSDVLLRDFDLKNPGVLPEASKPRSQLQRQPVFDYPGEFVTAKQGETLAQSRLGSLRHDADGGEGLAETVDLLPGRRFTVNGAAESDANGDFVVAEMTTTGVQHGSQTGAAHASRVHFRAFLAEEAYLPRRRARRPSIAGVQTALVVGAEKQDQSIHVDELGRIKVHFFWDRLQPADDQASCWIRVSQVALGGSMILPRVGWEVAVAFLEGNPDRPLVLGRVYNAENMPPLALPDNKASGALTSMSSPGGAGKNEISMGDSGGAQGFAISAQKDFNMSTGFDQTESVQVDDEAQVNENVSRSVKVDDTVEITGNQSMTFGTHMSCKVQGNQTLSVSGNETLNSTANMLEKVDGSRSYEVTGNQMLLCNGERTTITGSLSRTVGVAEIVCTTSSMSHNVGATSTSTVGAVRVHLTKGSQSEVVTGAKSITVGVAVAQVIKGTLAASCQGDTVRLVGGVVTRKITGDLSIKAPMISLVGARGKFKGGSSELNLAGGPITIKGGKIVIKAAVVKKGGSMKLG